MTAPLPPYLRVADEFRERISSGVWPPGYKLPSRAALSQEFLGASRDNVIRRAQELLISEGLLEGRSGSGTYVRADGGQRTLRCPVLGLVPEGLDAAFTWTACSTPRVEAPEAVADRLAIPAKDACVRTDYTVLAPGQMPVLTTRSWEPMAVTGGTPVVLPDSGPLAGRTVAERMRALDIRVDRLAEVLTPVVLDSAAAKSVSAPAGSLAHRITRTHYAVDGRPVETAELLVPSTHWELVYDHHQLPGPADGAAAMAPVQSAV